VYAVQGRVVAMFVRVGEWFSDLTGAWSLPGWTIALASMFALSVAVLASVRRRMDGQIERLLRVSLIVLLVSIGYWVIDHSTRRDTISAEQQSLNARVFELAARAFLPGSPLACLAGPVGETVEEACARAIFSSPETTAAAVSYVAAQLSLLADARDHARRGGSNYGSALTDLRRMIEADRFGIVAHVLAVRDGCTPGQCAAFGFLQGTGRVSANLAERPFETHVKSHMAAWQSAGARPLAGAPVPAIGATGSVAPAKPASSAYFPSSTSIPQVNIIAAEPPASQPNRDSTTAAAAAEPASPRKPPANPPPVRQPSNSSSGPAASGPLQLAPNVQ
jgi:hypothetical protein